MLAGLPHSEISGSQVVCHLPEAYRRLQRPSSPLAAKASTVYALSLDHITQNSHTSLPRNRSKHTDSQQIIFAKRRKCQHSKTLTSLITTQSILLKIYSLLVASETDFRNQKKTNPKIYFFLSSLHIFSCRAAALGGAKRDRTADLLRARQALSQLSYGPKNRSVLKPALPGCTSRQTSSEFGGSGWT